MLTADRLRELLDYNPTTGVFTWRINRGNNPMLGRAGDVAGNVDCDIRRGDGYWRICVDGVRQRAHRLAWLHVYGEWPTNDLDHRDRNKLNNAIANLRLATTGQNKANSPVYRGTASGLKGVYKNGARWQSQIRVNGKLIYLGKFDSPEDAAVAYRLAAIKHHGEFAAS